MSNDAFENSPPHYEGSYKYDSAVARDYDKVRDLECHWQQEDQFIQGYLKGRKIRRLLDLPVGTGRFFAHYAGVENLTGIDISEEMLLEARKKLPLLAPRTRVILELGNVLDLRFSNQEFDVAIVCRLFHLLPMDLLEKAVCELCRVTRGEVVVQTYVPTHTPLFRGSKLLKRVVSRLYRLLGGERAKPTASECEPNAKPWSHIQAYYHKQSLIDSWFRKQGMSVSVRKLLDYYEGREVRATVYCRQ